MQKLPGTLIPVERPDPVYVASLLETLFAGGGLVLSQVTAYIGAEGYSVQNWVKRGFVSAPVAKRYTKRQFCRLAIINMLKDSIPISEITWMLSYINGDLSDESDDIVGDDALYLYFVSMLQALRTDDEAEVKSAALRATANYKEPIPGGAEKVREVLTIMYYAYRSAELSRRAAEKINICKLPAKPDQ